MSKISRFAEKAVQLAKNAVGGRLCGRVAARSPDLLGEIVARSTIQ
jgi:hypothetical protein